MNDDDIKRIVTIDNLVAWYTGRGSPEVTEFFDAQARDPNSRLYIRIQNFVAEREHYFKMVREIGLKGAMANHKLTEEQDDDMKHYEELVMQRHMGLKVELPKEDESEFTITLNPDDHNHPRINRDPGRRK